MNSNDIKLQGVIVDAIEWGEGFMLVANFMKCTTFDNTIESKATGRNGFNILLVQIDMKGALVNVSPIFSDEPVVATDLQAKPDGRLWIQGVKGDFVYAGKDNVTGGDYWEYFLEQ